MFNLTVVAEEGNNKSGFDSSEYQKSPNWYQTKFDKVRRVSFAPKKKTGADDASEKSLRDSSSASVRSQEGTMHIMVSRSFVVTDAERNSYIEKVPR
jgi:hypothetical protein